MNSNSISNISVILIIFILLFSCKTTEETSTKTTGRKDPTKFTINKNDVDELRDNIKGLFELLEKFIAEKDYDGWHKFLSSKYKEYLNDKDELAKLSEYSDYLFNRNIKLKNAKDYFDYLVIPSREGKSLEFLDYELIDEKNINVISLFDKKEKYIYKFIYEDNSWKLNK